MMRRCSPRFLTPLTFSALLASSPALPNEELEIAGYLDAQWRYFPERAQDSDQHGNYLSPGGEVELYKAWNDDNDALTVTAFARLDQHDSKRDHIDFREANWLHIDEGWEIRAGLGKVFWGVTESQHLVDIINQTDMLEGADGEDKLGQPMINLTLSREWGDLSLFWLPYFRERHFAGEQGRLRPYPRIDADYSSYESDSKEHHQDFAARWSHTLGDLDLAVSHFKGTSREPTLSLRTDSAGNPILAPHYAQINQTGLELSLVDGDWLWKLEAIHRRSQGNSYSAAAAGFEYTLVGIADTSMDLGLLMEYHYDDRKTGATTPFQNDTFVGTRLTFNDADSSELLIGVIFDNGSSGAIGFIEASTRVGESLKVSLEARSYDNLPAYDPLLGLLDDDHLLLSVAYYF